jgi:hypothetical protein
MVLLYELSKGTCEMRAVRCVLRACLDSPRAAEWRGKVKGVLEAHAVPATH